MVFPLIIILGIPYAIGKGLYETVQIKFWRGPWYIIKYFGYILYQIWNGIKYLLMHLAIFPDLLANATSGEAIEDAITTEENTLFNRGDVTISTAIGELEVEKKPLFERGKKLSGFLSKMLGNNHCSASYKRWKHNIAFKLE